MKRQLSEVIKAFEHSQARLERLMEAVPEEIWSERTDAARWSVAECVAHINITNTAFLPRVRKAIEEARALPRKTSGRYKRDLLGAMFGSMVGPMKKIGKFRIAKVKTLPPFVPSGNLPKGATVAEFKRINDELIALTRECDGLAIDQVKITSPFGEKIHYNLYSALVMIPRHDERHLEQAELVWA